MSSTSIKAKICTDKRIRFTRIRTDYIISKKRIQKSRNGNAHIAIDIGLWGRNARIHSVLRDIRMKEEKFTYDEYVQWCLERGLFKPYKCEKCSKGYHYVCATCNPEFFQKHEGVKCSE